MIQTLDTLIIHRALYGDPFKMRFASLSFFLTSLSYVCCANATGNLDIGGVKIGIKSIELRPSIASMNSSLVVTDVKQMDGKVVGLQARKDAGSGWGMYTPDHFVGLFDAQGFTWFIGRAQKYEKGARPTAEATLNALREKYGNPSYADAAHLEWQFDRSGALYKGLQQQGPCWLGVGADMASFSTTVTSPAIRAPKKFAERCGSHITAMVQKEADGMIGSLVVSIYDSARVYDLLQREHTSAEAVERKVLEAEKTKAVKPKL